MINICSYVLIVIAVFNSFNCMAQSLSARDIVDKANELLRGKTSYSEMEMVISRPKWKRTLNFKGWSKGKNYSLICVTYPPKEKGQVFLKRQSEMWNYMPGIEKMIKIPPSMMMQSWMGSDLTNDDLIKGASIVDDYTQKIVKEELNAGYNCYVIELIPKEEALVVWGKIISWITKDGYMTLRNEYYDEDMYLVNTEVLSKIKHMGNREMPTFFDIIPEDNEKNKTTLEFKNVQFDIDIDEDFFSIQNMKKVR